MGRYYLMHKDNIAAILDVSRNYLEVIKYAKVLDNIFIDTNRWIKARITSYERPNIEAMLKILGINTTEQFVGTIRAVSATDCMWIQSEEEYRLNKLSWKHINVFNNRISNIIAMAALEGESVGRVAEVRTPSPQYRIDGTAEKCIRRKDGKLYLIKTSGIITRTTPNVRPYSQFIVSNIEEQLGFKHFVKYELNEKMTRTGNVKPYCRCELYTNENIASVAYGDSRLYDKDMRDLLNEEHGRVGETLREMLLLDSLTLNTDRHSSNIEFLYNSNSIKLIGIAPIFDNDCALGAMQDVDSRSIEGVYMELFNKPTRTGLGSFDMQAELVINRELAYKLKQLDVNKLHIDDVAGMSSKRKRFIKYLLERRMHDILQIAERRLGNG